MNKMLPVGVTVIDALPELLVKADIVVTYDMNRISIKSCVNGVCVNVIEVLATVYATLGS